MFKVAAVGDLAVGPVQKLMVSEALVSSKINTVPSASAATECPDTTIWQDSAKVD